MINRIKIKLSFKNRTHQCLKTILTNLNNKISDNKIDLESFLLLDDQSIEKLINEMGPQLKFKQKFRAFMQSVFYIIYLITKFVVLEFH